MSRQITDNLSKPSRATATTLETNEKHLLLNSHSIRKEVKTLRSLEESLHINLSDHYVTRELRLELLEEAKSKKEALIFKKYEASWQLRSKEISLKAATERAKESYIIFGKHKAEEDTLEKPYKEATAKKNNILEQAKNLDKAIKQSQQEYNKSAHDKDIHTKNLSILEGRLGLAQENHGIVTNSINIYKNNIIILEGNITFWQERINNPALVVKEASYYKYVQIETKHRPKVFGIKVDPYYTYHSEKRFDHEAYDSARQKFIDDCNIKLTENIQIKQEQTQKLTENEQKSTSKKQQIDQLKATQIINEQNLANDNQKLSSSEQARDQFLIQKQGALQNIAMIERELLNLQPGVEKAKSRTLDAYFMVGKVRADCRDFAVEAERAESELNLVTEEIRSEYAKNLMVIEMNESYLAKLTKRMEGIQRRLEDTKELINAKNIILLKSLQEQNNISTEQIQSSSEKAHHVTEDEDILALTMEEMAEKDGKANLSFAQGQHHYYENLELLGNDLTI